MSAMDAVRHKGPAAAAEFLGQVISGNVLFRAIEQLLTEPCSL